MRGRLALLTIVFSSTPGFFALSGSARAAEITDVASAFDDDNPFDFRLRVGYDHMEKRASLKRELELPGATSVPVFKDLLFSQSRDTLSLRAEISVFQDLMIYGALPIVLGDSREIRYDQSAGSACIKPENSGSVQPTCVDASNSTTVADGILPASGYDATNSGAGFAPGSTLVFRGPARGASASGGSFADGLDTLNLGITWGVLSQKRDDTKPTWTINLEGDISIGNMMKFDRASPLANHGVSDGLNKLIARTSISKRFRYADPYVSFWYQLPFSPRDGSLFIDYGQTNKNAAPQMQAGTVFGLEGVPWEKPDAQYKVAIQVQGRVEAHFDGRGYSEGWEMFATSPALKCDPVWNPSCDPTAMNNRPNAYQGQAFTGITQIENYSTLGADVALVVQAGRYVHFHLGFNYSHDQSHFITNDDVGVALDSTCSTAISGGRVHNPCDFNPSYRPIVNQIGRRYKVDNVDLYNLSLWAQLMF